MATKEIDQFDPYHVWLGIPAAEQPADYYRLLGVSRFEPSAEVIQSAADRQMAHVRTFQTGPYGRLSQRLLNEIADAKLNLLLPVRKAAYDRQRRDAECGRNEENANKTSAKRSADSALGKLGIIGATLGIAVPVVLLISIAIWYAMSPDDDDATVIKARLPNRDTGVAQSVVVPQQRRDVETKLLSRETERPWRGTQAAAPGPKDPPPIFDEDDDGSGPPPDDTQDVTSVFDDPTILSAIEQERSVEPSFFDDTDDPPKGDKTKPSIEAPTVRAADRPLRFPIPSDAIQRQIAKKLAEVYALDGLSEPREKIAQAKMLFDGGRSAETDADQRYVLLNTAADLAGDAGDLALMLRIVGQLGDQFDVDPLMAKADALRSIARNATTSNQIISLIGAADGVIDEAMAGDRFDLAMQLSTMTVDLGRHPQATAVRKNVRQRHENLRRQYEYHARVQKALATLESAPDNPAANLVVGRWYIRTQDNWKVGLAYVALGSDRRTRNLARRELAAPQSQEAQLELADAWWDLAIGVPSEDSALFMMRAGHWYDITARQGLIGLEGLRVQKRLERIRVIRQEAEEGAAH